ncbi:MAG TPA: LysM peptidoglycan-binding domain-containing protein, partial [Firmicutes bacterium]|nr:LysM peptidoglycan-binding domain-containing protein [Bacillota bacterium]
MHWTAKTAVAVTLVALVLLSGSVPVRASPVVLPPGSRGEGVRVLQELLRAHGLFTAGADGVYGPRTEQAVRSFQADQKLPVDGVVGSATWAALVRLPYVIQPGDTLAALATRFGTSVAALLRANPGLEAGNL